MKKRFTDTAPLLVCSLLVAACANMAFKTFDIALSFWFALLWAFVFVAAIYLLLINKKIALIFLATVAIAALIVYLRLNEDAKKAVFDFVRASAEFLRKGGELSDAYTQILGLAFIFAFSLVLILPAVIFPFFPALFAICLTLIFLQWGHNNLEMLTETSIILGALIVFFAHGMKINADNKTKKTRNISALWLLPFAAIIMVSVAGIAKSSDLDEKWEWLEVRTNIINDYFAEMTGSTSPRTIFDISRVGFEPLGGRLGGPVELDDTEIMKVTAKYSLLLRGNIKNTYTGLTWIDDSVSYRSRFINKFKDEQAKIFNLDLPDEELKPFVYFQDISTYIYPTVNGSATVFAPSRTTAVKPSKLLTMLISFNTEGEVFSSRDIASGISYTVDSEHIKLGQKGFGEYVLEVQSRMADEAFVLDELIELNYTKKFENVPQSVIGLTQEITAGIENDYLKALAIKEYLEDGFVYTLSPAAPPEDADFVEYFLQTKEGYCTYFASALAVMAREAGLPSRYVEGFKTPGGNSVKARSITGENAHAWAEIYINGFGWLPFEPATSSGSAGPGFEPEEVLDEEIFELPTAEPEIPDEPVIEVRKSPLPYIIPAAILLGLVFAAAIMLWASKLRANLRLIKSRSGSANEAVLFYYKEIMIILSHLKYAKPVGHTLETYAAGVDKKIVMKGCLFKNVASAASKILYAKQELTEEYVTSVHAYYWSILKYIKSRLGIATYLIIMAKMLFINRYRKSGLPF